LTSEVVFAKQAVQASEHALKRGEKLTARRWAERALFLAPEMELPWLILAALSKPEVSIRYIEHVLKLHPKSKRAKAGLEWAKARYEKQQVKILLEQQMMANTQRMAFPAIIEDSKKQIGIWQTQPWIFQLAAEEWCLLEGLGLAQWPIHRLVIYQYTQPRPLLPPLRRHRHQPQPLHRQTPQHRYRRIRQLQLRLQSL
jgi:hypothetical protein